MSARNFQYDEAPDPPDPQLHTLGLHELLVTSPAVAGMLPGCMRRLADEIENAIPSHVSACAGGRLPVCSGSAIAQGVTRKVASQISKTLSRNLPPEASGNPGVPLTGPSQRRQLGPGANAEPSLSGSDEGPRLELRLLGTPRIMLAGVRLTSVELCSSAAVIIYVLALHPGGLSGERLGAQIRLDSSDVDEPDVYATRSTTAHRTFIWRLRKLAGWQGIVVSCGRSGGRPNNYELPANTICDLWEFEDRLNQAERLAVRAGIEPDAADKAAILRQEAIVMYGGDFCTGIVTECITRAAEYLRDRYLRAVVSQGAYWKGRALDLQKARSRGSTWGNVRGVNPDDPQVEEEKAWLEALSNYRLAAHVEPYADAAHAGVMLCQAKLRHHARTGNAALASGLVQKHVSPLIHRASISRIKRRAPTCWRRSGIQLAVEKFDNVTSRVE